MHKKNKKYLNKVEKCCLQIRQETRFGEKLIYVIHVINIFLEMKCHVRQSSIELVQILSQMN